MTGTGGGKWQRAAVAAAVIALLTVALGGCGDDSATTTGSSGTTTTTETTDTTSQSGAPNPEFAHPGADESVQRFGSEAPAGERAAASAVLSAYLRAAVLERRVAQCGQLSAAALASLERIGGDCATALEAVTPDRASTAVTMADPVGSLRVEDGRAYALYHGRDGVDYAVAMRKEGGEWKVESLAPLELP